MKPNAGVTLLEILVVAGIFTLAIGLSLTVLSSSRLSVTVNEAQVRSQENARTAMSWLSKELRLSTPNNAHIYSDLGTPSALTGTVLYFQVPLEMDDGTGTQVLDLTAAGELQWGSQDNLGAYTLGNFIYYYLGGPNGDRLFRATSAAEGGGVIGAGVVIAPDIASITFERDSATSELVDIEVVAEAEAMSPYGPTAPIGLNQTLRSRVRLRN